MRDLLVTAFVFGSLPFILKKPYFGILMWTLMGLMNPHKLCWGFALTIPFAQIIAITLFISLQLKNDEMRTIPNSSIFVIFIILVIWMFITTFHAFNQEAAWTQASKVGKVMLLTFITIIMLTSKVRIVSLVIVIVISLGFYGIKGGIFTILTGGQHHVLGPSGTFIEENNSLGLAIVMTIPLMRFLQLQLTNIQMKIAGLLGIGLMLVAVAGSQSRGAFLGLIAMVTFLTLKSSKKGMMFAGLALLLPAIFLFMPESWVARMDSIQHYEQDSSALSRINAWTTIWRIALDYPLFGGGFEVYSSWAMRAYSPDPNMLFDVHSIYFEMLGEHGFVGLFLFLTLGVLSFRKAGRIARLAKEDERLSWMKELASMIQVSIVGYAVSGAFLGLAYYDYFYILVALVIGLQTLQKRYQTEGIPEYEGTAGLFSAVKSAESDATRSGKNTRNRRTTARRRGGQVHEKRGHLIKSWYQSL